MTRLRPSKSAWPELVGWHEGDANDVIFAERPDLFVLVRREGDPEPPTFQYDRVFLWCNETDVGAFIVSWIPVIG